LLERHRGRLERLINARIDNRLSARVDPSDVIQDTLAVAFRRLPDYLQKEPVPFYPWLRQIALDRLADLYRRHILARKRSVDLEEDLHLSDASAAELATRVLSEGTGPLSGLLRQEVQRHIHRALALLKKDDHEIIFMRYLEGLDTRAAAEVLGISESAAKLRLLRSVRRLRQALDIELGED
jgi:RNA polymerase sigma-70 factor (ECF subfamily)